MKVKPSRIRDMSPAQLARKFPNLNSSNHQITSDETIIYNCVSWILGDQTKWKDFYLTPDWDVDYDQSCKNYVRFFRKHGFKKCSSPDLEKGVEKIAFYENKKGEFTHVAKQLPDGQWTSKLGVYEDLTHSDLSVLEGMGNKDRYGKAVIFMERPI